MKVARDRIKAAQDRQKFNADLKRCPEEFEVGDRVLLTVSSMSGVVRFGDGVKSSPMFIRPYEILKRLCKIAYRISSQFIGKNS